MGARWGRERACAPLAILVAVALGLAGCGGSGSSGAERTKLANEVSAQLKASNAPADVVACVSQQSRGLPLAQLRSVAAAGANPPPAVKQVAVRLVVNCVKQGNGIASLHALIVQGILRTASKSVPPALTQCIIAKANATTPSQLSQLISAYATQNVAGAQAYARQVGIQLGSQCAQSPGVLQALRVQFLAPIRSSMKSKHYSAAFQTCVLKRSAQVTATQIEQFALNPPLGYAFGKNAAQACIASGAKP
jgi:hypothetical protein